MDIVPILIHPPPKYQICLRYTSIKISKIFPSLNKEFDATISAYSNNSAVEDNSDYLTTTTDDVAKKKAISKSNAEVKNAFYRDYQLCKE